MKSCLALCDGSGISPNTHYTFSWALYDKPTEITEERREGKGNPQ